jgi:peroxiredoxin
MSATCTRKEYGQQARHETGSGTPPASQKTHRAGANRRACLIGALAAFVTVGFAVLPRDGLAAATAKPSDITQKTIEEKAPDFVLRDLKDQKFRLSDVRGKKPVLIIFSTTWCSFCKAEIPHFKSLYKTYTKQGLEIVNIDIQESKTKVAKFTAASQLPYRVLLDEDAIVSGIYEIRGVPSLVLVDKNGMIVCRQCPNIDKILESMFKK